MKSFFFILFYNLCFYQQVKELSKSSSLCSKIDTTIINTADLKCNLFDSGKLHIVDIDKFLLLDTSYTNDINSDLIVSEKKITNLDSIIIISTIPATPNVKNRSKFKTEITINNEKINLRKFLNKSCGAIDLSKIFQVSLSGRRYIIAYFVAIDFFPDNDNKNYLFVFDVTDKKITTYYIGYTNILALSAFGNFSNSGNLEFVNISSYHSGKDSAFVYQFKNGNLIKNADKYLVLKKLDGLGYVYKIICQQSNWF